jgi:hypothetical protein
MVTERRDVNACLLCGLKDGTAGCCTDFLAIYVNIDHRHRLPRLLSKEIFFILILASISNIADLVSRHMKCLKLLRPSDKGDYA